MWGGRSEHSEGSLTPPGWVYPWSHRGLSWENLRDFTPSTPQTDGDVRLTVAVTAGVAMPPFFIICQNARLFYM